MASNSRSRAPRSGTRGLGQETSEDQTLWNNTQDQIREVVRLGKRQEQIVEDIRRSEKDFKQREPEKPSVEESDALQTLYREEVKISEQIADIGKGGNNNLFEKLDVLIALQSATENANVPLPSSRAGSSRDGRDRGQQMALDGPADSPTASPIVEKKGRLLTGGVPSRGSVPRDSVGRNENGESTSIEPNPKSNTKVTYGMGAEVAFRPKQQPGGDEPEWIKGIVVKIIGDNKTRRYDVQDPEPDENSTGPGQIYRTSASSMVAIPTLDQPLPDYPKGKHVLAQYPHTTTFYRAEVVSMKGSEVTLRFEGEDDAQSTQVVDRRFVLDHRGKVGQ